MRADVLDAIKCSIPPRFASDSMDDCAKTCMAVEECTHWSADLLADCAAINSTNQAAVFYQRIISDLAPVDVKVCLDPLILDENDFHVSKITSTAPKFRRCD